MVSFDVVSLFTNVPLEESINLAVDYIFRGSPNIKTNRNDLKKLFVFATSQTHFLFNGTYYDQVDGVAMGSPVAPVLANLFMGHHEKTWLESQNGSSVVYYRRYVDDIFCLFNNDQDASLFFEYLNSQHDNIRFTLERETDKKLAFLDVLLDNSNPDSVRTGVYRKKTYTGLLTNFLSFCPYSYKIGLIRTLVDRAYKINNTWLGFHKDIERLTSILRKNLFPLQVIERVTRQYITKALSPQDLQVSASSSTYTQYFKLPYIGPFSRVTQNRIKSYCKRYCRDLDIRLAFSSFKVRSIFGAKDPIPTKLRSRVVYKFSCASCNSCYVGETCRHFATRVREHLVTDRNSHIFKHLESSESCKNACSEECFTILDSAPSPYQLRIKEAIHIGFEKPCLNKQLYHVNLTLSF